MAPTFSSLRRWSVALILGLSAAANAALTVNNTVLIFAKDSASAYSAYSGLQGYGIPYRVVTVPSGGVALPVLNSTASAGNYGAIVVVSEVSYEYAGGTYASAITAAQWQQLYDYQTAFGVRMVRLDAYPGPDHGCEALGGTSVDQAISLTSTAGFPTANLKTGASMSTAGLYHYPAKITNATIATEVASFAAGGGFAQSSAAVINVIGKRQQMVWFLPFSTDWSSTSSFLQHAWIHWATRGFYTGFRRIYFSTQIDDVFLETELYYPNTSAPFRVSTADMDAHKSWMPSINAKMPKGSKYIMELAHNGNGNIEAAVSNDPSKKCNPSEAIEYDEQIDTPLEFMKPKGTGVNIWPPTPATYAWSSQCAQIDPLLKWMTTKANMNSFMHISHTFSHSSLNNATYSDVNKEITFNKAWLNQVGIDQATYFSQNGIVPPAITGLHNVDAISAWMDNNITNVVGDNTRPVLLSTDSPFWPLISTVAANGYAGLTIMPRWATNIYYNCDTPECTLREWIATSAGSGDFTYLLNDARATAARNMLGLRWDPYMFHQANLRAATMDSTTINGVTAKWSLLQMWVESVVNEMARLTDWPMITLKHDDLAKTFLNRMARDKCYPTMVYNYNADGTKIIGGTVSAGATNCLARIPVTFPGKVSALNGGTSEQVGNDPLTVWVDVTTPSTFTLSTAINV